MPENLDPSQFTGEHLDRKKREFFKSFEKKLEDPLDKYPNPLRPAYPTNNRMFTAAQGITKREYFVAMAMQGLLAPGVFQTPTDYEYTAMLAIRMADALLKQLGE